jgi:hypothetical protein
VKPTASQLTACAFLLASAACETSLTGLGGSRPDGTWAGQTSQAGREAPRNVSVPGYFSFTVADDAITQVTFTVSHGDECSGMFGIVADVNADIREDGSFEVSNPTGTPPFIVTGTFAANGTAAGSLTAAHAGIVCASASTVKWTARRREPGRGSAAIEP